MIQSIFNLRGYEFIVQRASREDVARLVELHTLGFRRGWSTAEMQAILDRPDALILIARVVGRPKQPLVGFVIISETKDEAEVLSIAVDPAWRKRDIGELLMREAIKHLVSDRVKSLFLEVDETNTAARRLYKKLGFEQVGSRPGYYRSVDESDGSVQRSAALVMRLGLD